MERKAFNFMRLLKISLRNKAPETHLDDILSLWDHAAFFSGLSDAQVRDILINVIEDIEDREIKDFLTLYLEGFEFIEEDS